jgi:hypothetical protein
MFCIRPTAHARGSPNVWPATFTTWHTAGKHPAAGTFDNCADNIGKAGLRKLILAYFKIIGDFLPVSMAVADFRDVDFQQ